MWRDFWKSMKTERREETKVVLGWIRFGLFRKLGLGSVNFNQDKIREEDNVLIYQF